jgi:hypothetical protein
MNNSPTSTLLPHRDLDVEFRELNKQIAESERHNSKITTDNPSDNSP